MIQRLEQYYDKHGHSRVSPEQDPQLHKWTVKLRNNYRHQAELDSTPSSTRGRGPLLSSDKLKTLERLEFPWSLHEHSWKRRFQQLCEFRNAHGHCRVPFEGPQSNKQLAIWVANQRREHRRLLQGENSTLTEERQSLLQNISFFDDFTTFQDVWDLRMEELQDYFEANNHTNVPHDYEDNYALGQWVMNLRTQYKRYLAGLPTCLTPSRIAALEVLDFCWNMDAQRWFTMMERVKRASQHDVNLDNDLQLWIIKQRHLYQRKLQNRTSSMTDIRIKALEEISNWSWKGRDSSNSGPTVDDWTKLFEGIRQKGITPDMPPELPPWFEGRRVEQQPKEIWTEQDLLNLWNSGEDE